MRTTFKDRRSPAWWQPQHESGWDRVKAALHRDWEQTKADFSGEKRGADLNQHVGDTVRQALGKEPIPPENVPNPLTTRQVEKKVERAMEDMEDQAERIAEATERSVERQRQFDRHGQVIVPNGLRGWEDWNDAEVPLRYGYGASKQYPETWDDAYESRLRQEWGQLYPDQPWDDVRDTVRSGWDRGRS